MEMRPGTRWSPFKSAPLGIRSVRQDIRYQQDPTESNRCCCTATAQVWDSEFIEAIWRANSYICICVCIYIYMYIYIYIPFMFHGVYHIMLYHIVLRHIISCHTMSYHIMSYYARSQHICHIILCYIELHHMVFYEFILM